MDKIIELINIFGWESCLIVGVIFLFPTLFYIVKAFAPKWAAKWSLETEKKKMQKRENATPRIKEKMSQLLLNTKADRAVIIEFHNGKENATGLPFKFGQWSYEVLSDDNECYIGEKYLDMNLSLYSIPDYLYENKFFIGSESEFKKVDNAMHKHLMSDNTKYLGMILLRKSGVNIGILMVIYTSNIVLSKDKIHGKLGDYAQEIATLLDVNS